MNRSNWISRDHARSCLLWGAFSATLIGLSGGSLLTPHHGDPGLWSGRPWGWVVDAFLLLYGAFLVGFWWWRLDNE